MSLLNRVVLPVVAVLGLAFLVGCGSGTNNPVPPPSGAFSNTSFNGSYTFSISGQDIDANSNISPFVMAGTITACGCTGGMISAGTVDLSDDTGTGPGLSVNSGSTYSVSKDGRGTINLSIANGSNPNISILLDFVLTSSSHGLISRFDTGGTGSGTIDLQPNPTVTLSDTSYAFTLSGFGAKAVTPFATLGSVALTSGNISSGVEDFNNNGTPLFESTVTGSVQTGNGTAPGLATITTPGFGTFTFDVYSIGANHLKLIETDGQAIMVGDVFTQSSTTLPTGNFVFTVAGPDLGGNLFAAGGTFTSGSSQFTNGLVDFNDDGVVDNGCPTGTPCSFSSTSITNTPSGSGRYFVSLSGFAGGTKFVAYTSDAGLLLLEADTVLNAGVTSGMALAQSQGAALASSQGYALNLTGEDVLNVAEIDEIGQFNTTTSSGMNGLIDLNDFNGTTNPNTSNLSGSFTANSNGTGSASFSNASPLGAILYYAADSSTVLFISVDSGGDTGAGVLESQSAPSSAAADVIQRQVAMVKTAAHIRSAAANRRKTEKNN